MTTSIRENAAGTIDESGKSPVVIDLFCQYHDHVVA
jgi:hypothetical protein